jgi:UDP:flavonoid glycosyltransferase YjiC (YdhE family)
VARILLVTWDGGGNVPPAIGIAGALRDRGHDVRVLGHEQQRAVFSRFAFTAYRHALPWSRTNPRTPTATLEMFVDDGSSRDVEEVFAGEPADVVIADCLMLGALQAAQAYAVPTIVLVHSFYGHYGQTFADGPVAELGRPHGRAPRDLWDAADAVLVATDRELDPATAPIPANVYWTGVIQPQVAPVSRERRERVLVSLSTVWFEGQQDAAQRVLDALAELPLDAVATVDESIAAGRLQVPSNVELLGVTPHCELMSTASLVVGHGGHATTMLALAHDLPLLIVPQHPRLDQPLIGHIVMTRGAGLALEQDATTEQLREALVTITTRESYAEAAALIGARLRRQDGAARAAEIIEAIAAEHTVGRARGEPVALHGSAATKEAMRQRR